MALQQTVVPDAHDRPKWQAGILLVPVVGLLLVLAGLTMAVSRYDFIRQPTYAMTPALTVGQTVVVDTANRDQVERGDIVLVNRGQWPGEPAGEQTLLRVVGLPGDKLAGTDGQIRVNGKDVGSIAAGASPVGPFEATVPAGRVFVVGDNRELARDSRFFLSDQSGTLPMAAVEGRAVGIALPTGAAGGLENASMTYLYLSAAITALGAIAFLVGAVLAWQRRPRRRA